MFLFYLSDQGHVLSSYASKQEEGDGEWEGQKEERGWGEGGKTRPMFLHAMGEEGGGGGGSSKISVLNESGNTRMDPFRISLFILVLNTQLM